MSTQHQNLQKQVENLLQLRRDEPTLQTLDDSAIRVSLRKATSPTFEIVFAGVFSAGKSMLINALLGKELLYSAEGHATGTECYIKYAEPNQERVVLTFLSREEIQQQVSVIFQQLGVTANVNLANQEVIPILREICEEVIQKEGGDHNSTRARKAHSLKLLIEGLTANGDCIQPNNNAIYPMEKLDFSTLQEAAQFARRGKNSAVLKKIEYYYHHELLKEGNVIIDTPGIDAPVERDAQRAFDQVKNPETSAVVFVPKFAKDGDWTPQEIELRELIRSNYSIRDRVFYVFNYVDETWYNSQLRQRLDSLISSEFQNGDRIYKTSALLGFYGNLIQPTRLEDKFGLNTIFAESVKGLDGQEETPQFVYAFNNYCGSAGKLPSQFRISIHGFESPNDNYVRILSEWGQPLIEQLIQDSGVDKFKQDMTRYLKKERYPQLFKALADDLEPLCISLREQYLESWRNLERQPTNIADFKTHQLNQLSYDLSQIGEAFRQHLEEELNQVVASNNNQVFEQDFNVLKRRMINRLDELIQTFSVEESYQRAAASHPQNSVVPVLGILTEGFYYLANELEEVLVDCSEEIVMNFFSYLCEQVHQAEYYYKLYRLLGNDAGIQQTLNQWEEKAIEALKNEAKDECNRYVRERPDFYSESTVSIFQLRETFKAACQGYGLQPMDQAQPAIRQLLKIDFEPKVKETILQTFRASIGQVLINYLRDGANQQANFILQRHDEARVHLAQILEKEAAEQIEWNNQLKSELKDKIECYNQAVTEINKSLVLLDLDRHSLPLITSTDMGLEFPRVESLENQLDLDKTLAQVV